MQEFNRQLSPDALKYLKELSASRQPNWWRDLLSLWTPSGHEGELRLAIRNGYMNFYSCGQSIAKIHFSRLGKAKLQVHRKYVTGAPDGGQQYVGLLTGQGCDERGNICAWRGAEMLHSWIRNSKKYRGPEKCNVDRVVAEMPTVIDLEIGLPAWESQESALRMDMVALERKGNAVQIVFWEAKMINDGRLRSRTIPKVFEQIENYELFLAYGNARQRVIDAYRQNCKILCQISDMAREVTSVPPLDEMVLMVAHNDVRLDVASTPRLLIFDDGARRDEAAWQKHLLRLTERMSVIVRRPIVQKGTPA